MKKRKRRILFIFIIVIVVVVISIAIFRLLSDENNLTIKERTYINNARSSLIDINVLSTSNVFGNNGRGVFYDFLDSFESEYNLSFNKIYITVNSDIQGLSLTKSKSLPNNAKLFYTDHYVLVSKTFVKVSSNSINNKIGVLKDDVGIINKYIKSSDYKTYNSKSELLSGLKTNEVSFIAVPRIEYLDIILDNLYSIVYHISDMKEYYYLMPSNNETLNSILNKYYNTWDDFKESFNRSLYALFTNKLKITEKELDIINSKKYTYGFITNTPYDVKKSGTYGGIMASYIEDFSEFSNIALDYKEYNNINDLKKGISKSNVDLYIDYYNLNSFVTIDSLFNVTESVVMSNKDDRVFNSLASLSSYTVYTHENSLIKKDLENNGLKVNTYNNTKEIDKLLKNKEIVIMDYPEYIVYSRNNKDISERFRIVLDKTYNFKSNNDSMFNRLFTYYISMVDPNSIIYTGINNYDSIVTSGKLISQITKIAVILILGVGGVSYIIYKSSKKIYIKQRIKKTDKMKYIDVLTSLKNRNFLTENIPKWNQNTIYPQAIILINLIYGIFTFLKNIH